MNEKSIIWVAYDTSKTDLSCVVCTEPNNGRAKMRVGYMGDDADELYRIVSEQGYLAEHDKAIRNRTIEDVEKLLNKIALDKVTEIKCDDGEIRNRPLIDIARVYEILEQMKEGGESV